MVSNNYLTPPGVLSQTVTGSARAEQAWRESLVLGTAYDVTDQAAFHSPCLFCFQKYDLRGSRSGSRTGK